MTTRCKRNSRVAALVLAAHIRVIDAFLAGTDQCALAQVSRLTRALSVHASVQQAKATTKTKPDAAAQPATIPALHASLMHISRRDHKDSTHKQSRHRRRNGGTAMVPTVSQLGLVIHDLALVAQGVRVSCLVDCCALAPAFATLLLQTLALPEWRTLVPDAHRVTALALDSNVFFVNHRAFLTHKCVDLASQLRSLVLANVSAHLPQPTLLVHSTANSSGDTGERVDALMDAIAAICDQLIDANLANRRHSRPSWRQCVLALTNTRVSSTALAGIVLCYPVVYDLYDPNASSSDTERHDDWDAPQTNCLSARPLAVLQTFVASEATPDSPESSAETFLQEFSVPMCVLERSSSHDTSESAPAPTLALLRATSKCQLARALAMAAAEEKRARGSKSRLRRLGVGILLDLDSAAAGVRVTVRTLDRVAL